MSLTRRVADMVYDMGSATLDDLAPLFEEHTRRQVHDAMKNARATKLIHCEGHVARRGMGRGAGSVPARYYPGSGEARPAAPALARPAASVWELGQERIGIWPPQCPQSRQYQPLGGWTDEGASP